MRPFAAEMATEAAAEPPSAAREVLTLASLQLGAEFVPRSYGPAAAQRQRGSVVARRSSIGAIKIGVLAAELCTLVTLNVLFLHSLRPGGASPLRGSLAAALLPSLCCIAAYYFGELYELRILRRFEDTIERVLRVAAVLGALLLLHYTVFPQAAPMGGNAISTLALLGLVLAYTVSVRWVAQRALVEYLPRERIVLIGQGPLAVDLLFAVQEAPVREFEVVGLVGMATLGAQLGERPAPCVGMDQLDRLVESTSPDRIVVALTERRGRLPIDDLVVYRSRGIVVEDGTDLFERLTGKLAIEQLQPSTLVFSRDFQKPALQLALRRILDVAVSLAVLLVLAPLFPLVALLIRLDSAGPVFFRQERIGRFARPFTLLKLRTMRPPSQAEAVSAWTGDGDNDRRITRVGRFLRRFRLDELPQLWNVLRGQMALVGPRPHPVSNYELFERSIPYYSLRQMVLPGITGWAQVRYGYANNLAEETEKMRYDLYYIKNRSLLLDLRIALDTLRMMVVGGDVSGPREPR